MNDRGMYNQTVGNPMGFPCQGATGNTRIFKHKVEEHLRDKDVNLGLVLVSREETLDLWGGMAGMAVYHKVIKGTQSKLLVHQVVIKGIRDKHRGKVAIRQLRHNSKRCRLVHLVFLEKFRSD